MEPYGNGGGEEVLAIVLMFAICIGVLIAIAIGVVICLLLYKCLQRVPAEHRKMEPGYAFLLLIPLFNLVWNFFVYQRIPESYASYFKSVGHEDVGDCGRMIGLWFAICSACSIVPLLNWIAGPAALVLLVIFLVKVWGLRGQIPDPAVAAPLTAAPPPPPPATS